MNAWYIGCSGKTLRSATIICSTASQNKPLTTSALPPNRHRTAPEIAESQRNVSGVASDEPITGL